MKAFDAIALTAKRRYGVRVDGVLWGDASKTAMVLDSDYIRCGVLSV